MHVFQVQLPVVRNDGAVANTDYVIAQIVKVTGGVTVTNGIGYWQDSTGTVICDVVKNVQTYATLEQVVKLRAMVRDVFRQELDQDALVTAVWAADVQFVNRGA